VVVPCYRYGHFLETSVGSVLREQEVRLEVIVIDDASDDGSAEVARAIADRDPRVRVVVHEENAGHIATYNEGLDEAKGDYVVLLSADDALADGALARAVSLMQHHPNVGMVYGHAISFTGAPPETDGRARSWTVWDGAGWLAGLCRRSSNPVVTPTVVLRREAWEQVGRYDDRVPHAADMLLWFQVAARWDIGRVDNDAQGLYRVHGSNMHLTQYAGMLRDLQEQREVLRILFEETDGPNLPAAGVRAAGLRSQVRRARRLALAELRDSGDQEAAEALRRFADESIEVHGAARPGALATAVDAWYEHERSRFVRRVVHHLVWRVWRRFGV